MTERLVSPKVTEEEQVIEGSLRPRRLAEYIGQEKIKDNLSILLEAARRRKESVDHVLMYGPPGLGKTTLLRTLARALHLKYSRIQFTPDLVPADIVGTRIWRPSSEAFDIEWGPIFANIVLADPHRAVVSGPSALRGREFVSPDIRAGIAFVMAALISSGPITIGVWIIISKSLSRVRQQAMSSPMPWTTKRAPTPSPDWRPGESSLTA